VKEEHLREGETHRVGRVLVLEETSFGRGRSAHVVAASRPISFTHPAEAETTFLADHVIASTVFLDRSRTLGAGVGDLLHECVIGIHVAALCADRFTVPFPLVACGRPVEIAITMEMKMLLQAQCTIVF